MIYCLPPETYPKPEMAIEEVSYKDENDFEWKIARVKNGFFVKYFGDPYFKETYFSCDLESGEHVLINNTNCIFIQNSDFEIFEEVRKVIKTGYTDDIWEAFKEMFEERFEHDKGLLESELVDRGLVVRTVITYTPTDNKELGLAISSPKINSTMDENRNQGQYTVSISIAAMLVTLLTILILSKC